MRAHKQTTTLLFSVAIVLAALCPALGQGIYLDHVDGLSPSGGIEDGSMITFHMRVIGDETPHLMLNNGYTICSAELTWTDVTVEFNPAYPLDDWFDFVKVANVWADGMNCDTVGTGFLSLFGSGLPPFFDDILYTITVGPMNTGGASGATLTLDSTWYPPSNPWMWDVVGENVAWGGPYSFGYVPDIYTYCAPQPTILKQIERVLYIYIEGEEVTNVDLASIRIQGNIPSYEPAYIEGGTTIVASVFIMRFLGASGFRPVTGDFEATYTVDYNYLDGTPAPTLVGDFSLKVYPGDVTLDGQGNINDLIFAADYFWRNGDVPSMTDKSGQAWEIAELLDANQDGNIDPFDVIALKDILGL